MTAEEKHRCALSRQDSAQNKRRARRNNVIQDLILTLRGWTFLLDARAREWRHCTREVKGSSGGADTGMVK
ncbi:hypothetical protein MRX96_016470 [Rhipicephalus microplus]